MEKLKKCPFCGGEFEIVIVDNDENIRREEWYEENPVNGLNFGIQHNVPHHSCPIATLKSQLLGEVFYLSERSAINAINKRA